MKYYILAFDVDEKQKAKQNNVLSTESQEGGYLHGTVVTPVSPEMVNSVGSSLAQLATENYERQFAHLLPHPSDRRVAVATKGMPLHPMNNLGQGFSYMQGVASPFGPMFLNGHPFLHQRRLIKNSVNELEKLDKDERDKILERVLFFRNRYPYSTPFSVIFSKSRIRITDSLEHWKEKLENWQFKDGSNKDKNKDNNNLMVKYENNELKYNNGGNWVNINNLIYAFIIKRNGVDEYAMVLEGPDDNPNADSQFGFPNVGIAGRRNSLVNFSSPRVSDLFDKFIVTGHRFMKDNYNNGFSWVYLNNSLIGIYNDVVNNFSSLNNSRTFTAHLYDGDQIKMINTTGWGSGNGMGYGTTGNRNMIFDTAQVNIYNAIKNALGERMLGTAGARPV